MKVDHVLRIERTTKLGALGEQLAAERLIAAGFSGLRNLNETSHNFPFADLLAIRGKTRFLIGVKTRNEYRADGKLNESYNAVLVRDLINRQLKAQGWTVDQVTQLLLQGVQKIAENWDATPAWVAVAVRPEFSTYSAFFGTMAQLGLRRSIPMTPAATTAYEVLAAGLRDERITTNLHNQFMD